MKCFNRNVLIGLAAAALVLFFLVPSARGALPLLVVAACPLSMLLMMGGMAKMGSDKNSCASGATTRRDRHCPERRRDRQTQRPAPPGSFVASKLSDSCRDKSAFVELTALLL